MKAEKKRARGGAAAAAWLLVPLLVLVVIKTDCLPQVTRSYPSSATLKAAIGLTKATDGPSLNSDWVSEAVQSPISSDEIAGDGVDAIKDVAAPRSKLRCNFSSVRMNICALEGDVRMHGKSATVYLVAPSDGTYRPENGTVTIRPYARKWEMSTMESIRAVTIRSSGTDTAPPRCTITHDVPVVVFSTGGFSPNYFHAMGDIIIPLYITAREYDGNVMLAATDYDHKWIFKYRHIFAALSVYPVIDFDTDDAVRCFPSAHVGIESHDDLGIKPALSRNGYTMKDFQSFLRSVYSLKRVSVAPAKRSLGQRPCLVMLIRRNSRALTNDVEAIAVATEIGFDVVAAEPEMARDMPQFAKVVNTCDVIIGVHGAGLTNMLFLPHNGTVMQIIPWGNIHQNCWYLFGRPVPGMGLRYVEYEATAEETTLKDVYPRDHAVFTDPGSIGKESFDDMWKIFFNGQNVTVDIDRFRGVMQQIYQSVTIA
ncbi:unnamed protein product [Alopecurus aequalis]